MKKKYKLLLGLTISLFFGISSAFSQNQYYLDLDASNSYLYYPDDLSLSLMDGAIDYTIEAWVLPVSGRVNDGDVILYRDQSFSLTMYDGNGDGIVADFYFSVFDVATSSWIDYHTLNDHNLSMDAWNHIAIINNSMDNTLELYANDADVSYSLYAAQPLSPSTTTYNLFIGADQMASPNHSFGGYLDEIRLKNIAEVPSSLQMYTYRQEYLVDGNTAALFHFNEGSGTATVNVASGNNATLYNTITWRSWRYKSGRSLPLYTTFLWNGTFSGSSLYGPNWDTGECPSESDDVIVPSGTANNLEIAENDNFKVMNLTLESGATMSIYGVGFATIQNLEIEASAVLNLESFLTVENTLINGNGANGIIIKSSGNEIGSLIHDQSGIDATIERHIDSYNPGDPDDGWHYLSSPVGDYTIASSDFEPSANDDLFAWDDATGMWLNYHGTGFTELEKGIGYLCAFQHSATHTFANSTINVSDVVFNNIGQNSTWELLGNPFSSAIDWNSGSWGKININGAQVYSNDSRNWSPAGVIPATNGFMVEVNHPINQITIPADARVHDTQTWYKNDKVKDNTLEIKLMGDQDKGWDYTTIAFNEAATESYDPEYDYHKLYGQPSAPQIYTLNSGSEEFCVNTMAMPEPEKIVPLHIRIGYNGEYQISVKENSVETEGNIYLEDLKTASLTNLSNVKKYTFRAIKGEETDRFLLHFNSTTGVENIESASDIHIYSYAKSIYINSAEAIMGDIKILNIGGQIVYSQHLSKSNMHSVSVPALRGAYLVQFIGEGKLSTQKVIIQ